MTFREFCDKYEEMTDEQITDLGNMVISELRNFSEQTQEAITKAIDAIDP